MTLSGHPRKPDVYREKTATKHTTDIGEGFLKLLEEIEERGKIERVEQKQLLIDRANAVNVDADVVAT